MYRRIGLACIALSLSWGCVVQPSEEATTAAMKAALLEDAKATPETYTGKAYLIGTLDGTLAPALNASITFTPYNGTATDGPIFLSQSGLTSLSAADRTGIIATFQAHAPIILVNANEAAVNSLIQILHGQRFRFVKPPKAEYVELFAIDTEPNGNVYHWAMYPPANTTEDPDGQGDQQARVNGLIAWLKQDSQRDGGGQAAKTVAAMSLKDAAAADGSPSQELTELASAFVRQDNFAQYGNTYQIAHYVWGCHSLTTGDDWIYVQQKCGFNAQGAYKGKIEWAHGGPVATAFWYLGTIALNSSIFGYESDPSSVSLQQSSPETVNNVTEVESGADWEIGGEASAGKEGGEAKISAGVSINNSTSFEVEDCTVTNQSQGTGNNAAWSYQFKTCDAIPYIGYTDLTDPPSLATGNFSPVNQWIWRLSPYVRSTPPAPPDARQL